MFGTPKVAFSLDHLRSLLEVNNIPAVKEYIKQYFMKIDNPMCVLMWKPVEGIFASFDRKDLKPLYFANPYKKNKHDNMFDLCEWFFVQDCECRHQTMNPGEQPLFEIRGQKYVNHFAGYLHSYDPHKKFSDETTQRANRIWAHIKQVWCGEKEEIFTYVKHWISRMVSGRKMETALYLKSEQGTGKSLIIEFLREFVLGKSLVHTSDKVDTIMGNFNSELVGKVLLNLEEMPCETTNAWNTLTNALKHYVTGSVLQINEKHQKKFSIDNFLSIILNTNNNALKLTNDDRRWVVLPVSTCRKGDFKYFNSLFTDCFTLDVGEAFYHQCISLVNANPKFSERMIPVTEEKADMVTDNLHSLYKFIKEAYLQEQDGINEPLKEFYLNYTVYCADHARKNVPSKIETSRLLQAIKIEVKPKTNNVTFVSISHLDLLKTFMDKKWIHETDDIPITPSEKTEEWVDLTDFDFEEIIEEPASKDVTDKQFYDWCCRSIEQIQTKKLSQEAKETVHFATINDIEEEKRAMKVISFFESNFKYIKGGHAVLERI